MAENIDNKAIQVDAAQLEQLSQSLTFIMQDINLYAKKNGGGAVLGALSNVNLKLDDHHAVNIVCTNDTIKACFEPLA